MWSGHLAQGHMESWPSSTTSGPVQDTQIHVQAVPSQTQVIFNLRLSNHKLERKQYGGTPYDRRLCEHGWPEIGDEKCPHHAQMIAAVKARAGISGNGRLDYDEIQELMNDPTKALITAGDHLETHSRDWVDTAQRQPGGYQGDNTRMENNNQMDTAHYS